MRKKVISLVVLLVTIVNSVCAEKYTATLTSEFSDVPTIYAGVMNYFTLQVKNTSTDAGTNIVARLYCEEVLIDEKTITALPAGENTELNFVDPTIRPITENTINGNNNEHVVYKVVVEDDNGTNISVESSFVVLYNGYLGKDYAYNNFNPTLREYSFTGDVQIITCEEYSASSATSRNDAFTLDLNGSSVNKALLYVSYNWDKNADGDFNSWTTTFNEHPISPIANYRDQNNLGKYGKYGYGLVVYDVTDYVVNGNNTFTLQKVAGNVAVYPSSLIVMENKADGEAKCVYILEEADLLCKDKNKNTDAIYPSSFQTTTVESANLYVFAANAQCGEGDLIINNNPHSDVWTGTSQSVEVYKTAVEPGNISIQFKATGSTILALHQMVVVNKGNSTGIKFTDADNKIGRSYDLQGRELKQAPTQKGVYIRNGRKVVVK